MVKNIGPLLEYREKTRAYRKANGVECPGCRAKYPKRTPTKLVPGQTCKVCGWQDARQTVGTVIVPGVPVAEAPTSTASVIQEPAPATSESGA
jgi:hypothetical protein